MRSGLACGIAAVALALACTTVEEGDGGVAGSGSTTGGTTTGGSGGPPDNTQCLQNGGGSSATADELSPCSLNRDCVCPLDCIADAPRLSVLGPSGNETKFCERGCETSADCLLPSEVCSPRGDGGVCLEIPCGQATADGGAQNGNIGQVCNAIGTADGTCIPNSIAAVTNPLYDGGGDTDVIANGLPKACWLQGASSSACSLAALPSDTAERCPAGQACALAAVDGISLTGSCLVSCDPGSTGECPAGVSCTATPVREEITGTVGFCAASGSGGCLEGLPPSQSELFACARPSDCACPETCVGNPSGGASWCARSCSSTSDCPNPSTACTGNKCAYGPCGAQALGACNRLATGDGTCLSDSFSWAAAGPYCAAAGGVASGSQCSLGSPEDVRRVNGGFLPSGSVTFNALSATQFCAPGLLCIDDGSGQGTGKCRASCNDLIVPELCGDGGNVICYSLDSSGFGFCHGCHGSGSTCTFPSDCCSRSCSDSKCQ